MHFIYCEEGSQYLCKQLIAQIRRRNTDKHSIFVCSNSYEIISHWKESDECLAEMWSPTVFEDYEIVFEERPIRHCYYLNDHTDLKSSKWTRENVTKLYNKRLDVIRAILQFLHLQSHEITFVALSSVLEAFPKLNDEYLRFSRLVEAMEKCIFSDGSLLGEDYELEEQQSSNVKKLVIRVPLNILSAETGIVTWNLLPYQSGLVFHMGSSNSNHKRTFSFIHEADLVDLICFASDSTRFKASADRIILSGCSPEPATYADYYKALQNNISKRVWYSRSVVIPDGFLKYIYGYDRTLFMTNEPKQAGTNAVDPRNYGFTYLHYTNLDSAIQDVVTRFPLSEETNHFMWRILKTMLVLAFLVAFSYVWLQIYRM